ncbi:MAG: preprotein translocase subunit SecY [Candidatus Thorarchaeota archaeon]|nr:MAG: preprotein translocase subunit SecY [Candidatus Thorarchaeota archaeon]
MPSTFLKALSPFVRVMPEVKAPDREVSFREKFVWTAVVLIIFLIMSHMPLFGVDKNVGLDYLWAMRVILASTRGTLMELGIGPIVTAGLVMQLLSGSKIINVDFGDPEDRALFTGGQKVLALFMTAFQAIAYIMGNAYGTLTPETALMVFAQLFTSGLVIVLMDELVQKGWGLGSGVSLFIMTNVAGQVIYNSLNFIQTEQAGPIGYMGSTIDNIIPTNLPKGIIAAMISNIMRTFGVGTSQGDPVDAGWLFIRDGFEPSVFSLTITFAIFFAVIWMESVRVEIPLQYAKYRGMKARYPIKLLYTSNIPVILAQALYANILFFGQMIWGAFNVDGTNPFLSWIGVFERDEASGRMIATSGLAKYITPPQGIFSLLLESDGLLHVIIYASLMVLLCWGFSRIWVDISGIAPRDVSRQLLNSGYIVPGFRRSEKVLERLLDRYIPIVAGLGGFLIGILAAAADVMGALASGTGILLMVSIIKQYYEQIAKEQLAGMGGEGVQGLLGIL